VPGTVTKRHAPGFQAVRATRRYTFVSVPRTVEKVIRVSLREVAQLQVLLEGVPLPAEKRELIEYASGQEHEGLAGLLERLPDREYGSIDEVGEELAPVQPEWPGRDEEQPRAESDLPPGGDAYANASAKPGEVREHGPHD
jgi:hypothetical protein